MTELANNSFFCFPCLGASHYRAGRGRGVVARRRGGGGAKGSKEKVLERKLEKKSPPTLGQFAHFQLHLSPALCYVILLPIP